MATLTPELKCASAQGHECREKAKTVSFIGKMENKLVEPPQLPCGLS